jgi:N-acyl-phosphatidylethanolamine-hydrolysing phospholipase D
VTQILGPIANRPFVPHNRGMHGGPASSDVTPARSPAVAPPRPAAGFFWRRLKVSLLPRPGAAERVPFDLSALRASPTVSWIGHASLYVRLGRAAFLADPVYARRASPVSFAGPPRLVPPGIPLGALPSLDFVLLSHDHYDHTDLATLRRLAALGIPAVVPAGMGDLVRSAGGRATELAWWEATSVAGLRIHCVPSQHFSGRGLRDRNKRLWCGWVVETERAEGASSRFYFAGDTGFFPGFAEIGSRLGPPDLAALPIGAYEPRAIMGRIHVNPEEAVQAAVDLGARQVLGMHWGTFDLSDEPLDEPPRRFATEAARRGIAERTFVMKVGETRPF